MKKSLLLLVVLLLSLSLCLFSCGGKDNNNDKDTNQNENINPDENKPEEKPEHSHKFGEWITIKNPTCVENGEMARYCECGEKQTEVLYATGEHTEATLEAVAPTCTETGLTEGKSCSVCKEVLVAQTAVAPAGHTEVTDEAVAPTCTKEGLTEGKHCSVCGEVLVKQGVAPIVAHTYDDKYDESCNVCGSIRDAECAHRETEPVVGYEATCTEPGLTDGKRCTKCGEILLHQTSIEAKGHTGVITDYVAPTCTEEGLTAGKYCSVCDATLAPQSVIPMLDHDYKSEYSFDEASHWLECKDCGAAKDMAEHQLSGDSICAVCNMMMPTEGIVYQISDDGKHAIVTGYTGTASKVKIADTYEGLPVKNIYDEAFFQNNNITSVIIPDSVTSIGVRTFYSCDNLSSAVIPDSVTSIGKWAFYYCESLSSIVIGDSVTSIGEGAFGFCTSLNSIIIPDSVTSIDNHVFYYCESLSSAVIPDSVMTIGNHAFYNCDNLSSVVIPGNVTSIGDSAFFGCSGLSSVVIPDSVTSIGKWAFYGCSSLSSVVIPYSVTTIGDEAFFYCLSLTSINVDENNNNYKSIDGNLYTKDGKTLMQYAVGKQAESFAIPTVVTTIGEYAFSECSSLSSVVIPDSVTTIGEYAFWCCTSLSSIVIGDGVTTIGSAAFYYCTSLSSINVDENNNNYKSIDGNLYTKDGKTLIQYAIGKQDESFTIPTSVISIGDYAFYDCRSLSSVVIPDSVTSIGSSAFSECSSLSSVVIPDSVTTIGEGAFYGCTSLTDVYYTGSEEEWKQITIDSFGNDYLTGAKIYYNYTAEN